MALDESAVSELVGALAVGEGLAVVPGEALAAAVAVKDDVFDPVAPAPAAMVRASVTKLVRMCSAIE